MHKGILRKALFLLSMVALAALAPLANAHDGIVSDAPSEQQHGEIDMHFSDAALAFADEADTTQRETSRPALSRNLSLVGRISFGEAESGTTNTDVWALGGYAYVGTFSSPTCAGDVGLGVKVVDIRDPGNPQWIGTLESPEATRANDVKAARIATPFFAGDLLVHTNEPCRSGGDGGIRIYDISDPTSPVHLADYYSIGSRGPGPGPTAFGVHNTYLYSRGERAYVLVVANISVDAFDFRIVDVTNPTAPVEVGRWSATASPDAPQGISPRGSFPSLGLHDVWASTDGKLAYLSNWDAGYILLDVSDPGSPQFLGGSSWGPDDEGNAHAAVPARGGNLLIAADEDFDATGVGRLMVNSGPHAGLTVEAIVGAISPSFSSLSGDVAWIGLGDTEQDSADDPAFGCSGGQPYGESVAGKIALIKRGFCTFSSKIDRAAGAGAVGAIVFNNRGEGLVTMGGTPVGIPSVFIAQSNGEALAADREAAAPVDVTMESGRFNGWGFARIFDTSDPGNIKLLSNITLPSTFDPTGPNPAGVHNVYVRGNTAYFSWYMDGLVLVDFSRPAEPRVTAQFNDNNNFWGIYVQNELIFASDRSSGLWIFKRTP